MAVERGITAKVKLDGEEEYKRALKEISNDLSMCSSEMKKTTAEYANNADSVEALTAKSENLEKQLTSQEQKIALIRERLKQSTEANGEADEATQKLQRDLNKAEADFYNTSNAIENNNKALEEAKAKAEETGEATTNLGDLLDDISNKFGITLPDSIKTTLNDFGSFSSGAVVAVGAVATAVTALIKVYDELIEVAKESASYVDDLNTMAVQSGIDTYTLQVLNYMEDLADVDVSSVTGSMTKLIRSMSDARDGTESTIEAFQTLGVAFQDSSGNLLDSNDVFWAAIDALGEIENETERDAVAMEVFGKSARDLNTLVALGSEGFREFAEEAENAGYILDDQANDALNDYNDALDRAEKQMDAVKNQLSAEVAPSLQYLTEGFYNLVTEGIQLLIDSPIIDVLESIAYAVGFVFDAIGELIEVLNALAHPLDTIRELFGYSTTTVEENAAATKLATEADREEVTSLNNKATAARNASLAMDELTQSQKEYLNSVGINASNIGTIDGNYVQAIKNSKGEYQYYSVDTTDYSWADAYDWSGDTGVKLNASGDQNFAGGLTWVGENGAELVSLPSGSQIMTAQESRSATGNVYNITIDAKSVKEFNDIVRIAQNSRVTSRMRG